MSRLKYVNFEHVGIVIFEEHVDHGEMAQRIGAKPVSAGFVSLPLVDSDGNEAACFGESVSLGLASMEADTALLRRRLNPYR